MSENEDEFVFDHVVLSHTSADTMSEPESKSINNSPLSPNNDVLSSNDEHIITKELTIPLQSTANGAG